MKTILAILMVVSMFIPGAFAANPDSTEGLQITPPDETLPPEVKAFFGTNGKWMGEVAHHKKGFSSSKIEIAFISMTAEEAVVLTGSEGNYEKVTGKFFKESDGTTHLVIPKRKGDWNLHVQGMELIGNSGIVQLSLKQR
jgi:hypothetical protein